MVEKALVELEEVFVGAEYVVDFFNGFLFPSGNFLNPQSLLPWQVYLKRNIL